QTTLISNTVISTGGGILTRMRNGLYMKDFGFVIYLELDIKHQAQRLLADDQLSKRPIVRDCKNIEDLIKKLEDLHEKRDLTYEYFADYTIKVGGKTPEEIVNQIINFLNENKIIHEKDFLENFAGRMHYNPYKRLRRNKQIQKLRQEERGAGKKQEYRFIDNE
ncbi:shikimate kinase, partial [Psittacicella gerlachiana]